MELTECHGVILNRTKKARPISVTKTQQIGVETPLHLRRFIRIEINVQQLSDFIFDEWEVIKLRRGFQLEIALPTRT